MLTFNGIVIEGILSRPKLCVQLATRVAEEKGCLLGQEVGYSIRFDECYTPGSTKIKYLTEGILVNEMMSDPLLSHYSVVMLDEVHEQTVYTDVTLGLLRKILQRRPELRLVVASATMEAERLAEFFQLKPDGGSTILGVEGRTFPVEVYYSDEPVADYVRATIDTIIKIHNHEPHGDVLAFLTGQDEVLHVVSELIDYARKNKDQKKDKMLVVPMYGALPPSDQLKVFQPTPRYCRKVVVATNVAEASVTINGIIYIVDCGFVKLRYFNPRTRTDGLVVVPVSQASAEQRAGRAGRVRSGKAYRLYTEEAYQDLPAHTPPEIQRTSLESVVLQLKALGIDNLLRFHFPSVTVTEELDIIPLDYRKDRGCLAGIHFLMKNRHFGQLEFLFSQRFDKNLLSSSGEAPPSGNMVAALELLYALGVSHHTSSLLTLAAVLALDDNGTLTSPLGDQMAEFPLEPRFAKMLLASGNMGCSEEALTIAAMLQVQHIFTAAPNQSIQLVIPLYNLTQQVARWGARPAACFTAKKHLVKDGRLIHRNIVALMLNRFFHPVNQLCNSGVVPLSRRLFEPLVNPPGGHLSVAEGLRHNLVHGEVAAIFIQAILDLFKGYPRVCAHHFVDSSHG
ncbi:DHX35 [Cordylochernes scorpioides]|uniref:RNA helicase n=1 Tax=Cordylochernes scorpioides TaxID=51811 RepID=A0ABY6L4M7_9ARAC|nr:DHX35 [Cordylochernes scorpioides]